MCTVSICIPAYQSVEKIQKLLDSIECQTYKDYEIVITDDSTNDDVKNYIKLLDNPKIKYFKNPKQLGASENCNEAIRYANGKYIKMMHHDDWFSTEDSLGIFVELIEKTPNTSLAFSGSYQVSSEGKRSRGIADDKAKALKKNYRILYDGNWVGAPSATIFKNTGDMFDSNIKWLVDTELYMRILENGCEFAYTTDPLVSIGVGDEQLTNRCEANWKLQLFEHRYVLNKLGLWKYPDSLWKYVKVVLLCYWKIIMKKKR